MKGSISNWPQVAAGKTEGVWPHCPSFEGGTNCLLSRGHVGLHRNSISVWGDEPEIIEEYQLLHAKLRDIASQVGNIHTNYIGPDGRAAAAAVRNDVLKILAKELKLNPGTPPRGGS